MRGLLYMKEYSRRNILEKQKFFLYYLDIANPYSIRKKKFLILREKDSKLAFAKYLCGRHFKKHLLFIIGIMKYL